jgi:uncharacterized protein
MKPNAPPLLKSGALRYCPHLPLPAGRYIPGRSPKEEHRKDLPKIKVEDLPPEQWQKNEAYLYGFDLYRHGFFYEAHEVWEELWHKMGHKTIPGLLLKALIQNAAVQLKMLSGDLKTAGRMRLRAGNLLEQVLASIRPREDFMGLSLVSLLKDLSESENPQKSAPRLELKLEKVTFPKD